MIKQTYQRILKLLAVMAVLLCVAAVPALAQTSTLFVSDVSPNGGSTNVAANSNISATFDVRMDRTTINTTTFYLKQKGSTAVVPAQVAYNRTTKTATLNPDANLASGATYTAFVKGGQRGVKGTSGQTLGGTTDATATFANAKVSWKFTVADTTAPTVSNVSPADGAPGVALNTNVAATFSKAMAEASVEAPGTFTLEQGSSPVAATVTYDPSTRVATLDPSSDLASNTTYTATVSTGAKDLAGNAIVQEETWSFTTKSVGVTVSPDTLDLSTTDPLFCSPRQEFLTVTNNGPGNVTFADVSITGPDAAYFSDGAKSFILNNGPFTVLEGNFFEDQVTFRPGSTIPDRNRDYEAILTYKDGAGATIGDPVALTATTSCLVF